jgi:hypothetical protein
MRFHQRELAGDVHHLEFRALMFTKASIAGLGMFNASS